MYHDDAKQQKLLLIFLRMWTLKHKGMLCVFMNNNEHGSNKIYQRSSEEMLRAAYPTLVTF